MEQMVLGVLLAAMEQLGKPVIMVFKKDMALRLLVRNISLLIIQLLLQI